jgi:heat shock protein HslJ
MVMIGAPLCICLLAACSSNGSGKAAPPTTTAGTPASADVLRGEPLELLSYFDPGRGELVDASTNPASAHFERPSVYGTNGCTTFSASYTLTSGGSLSIGHVTTKAKGCDDPAVRRQAQVFDESLQHVVRAVIDGGHVEMLDRNGFAILIFHLPS